MKSQLSNWEQVSLIGFIYVTEGEQRYCEVVCTSWFDTGVVLFQLSYEVTSRWEQVNFIGFICVTEGWATCNVK